MPSCPLQPSGDTANQKPGLNQHPSGAPVGCFPTTPRRKNVLAAHEAAGSHWDPTKASPSCILSAHQHDFCPLRSLLGRMASPAVATQDQRTMRPLSFNSPCPASQGTWADNYMYSPLTLCKTVPRPFSVATIADEQCVSHWPV